MKILLVHNRYQQAGGEDNVFEEERDLLRDGGQDVSTLEVSNVEIRGFGAKVSSALGAVYNQGGKRLMRDAITRERPDIVHVHNFFPLLSPSIFDACSAMSVPAVWTLHNFRVVCANGLLLRDGKPCEDCIGRPPWAAAWHRCYRGSLHGSLAVAAMIGYHQLAQTWQNKVTRFIALTEFAREIYIRAGLPAEKIAIKPNFIRLPKVTPLAAKERKGFAFVGRLSHEKGVRVLLEAWKACDLPLTIVGDGPLMKDVRDASARNPVIEVLGQLPKEQVYEVIRSVKALIVPSIWYEGFPLVAVEAMALKTPVIASRIGSLSSLIVPNVNGLLFQAGSALELKSIANDLDAVPSLYHRLLENVIRYNLESWNPEWNLHELMKIYEGALSK